MRKVLILFAMLAVAGIGATATQSASRASATVSITSSGFNPSSVSVQPGDTVTWKNNDTTAHQVVSDTGVFQSPKLAAGQSYSYKFDVESSYSYHDSTRSSSTGTVNVLTTRPSIGLTRIRVVYGNPVRIFGAIPSSSTGDNVTVHLASYGGQTVDKNVVTFEGTYELTYRPKIRTDVSATWKGNTSQRAPSIGVRPLVIFRALNLRKNLFFVKVRAAKSYAHKLVRIKRQNHRGIWKTTRIVRLNRKGEARFTGTFAPGTTKAQAWVAKTPGYVAGFSVIKLVSR